jgi:nitroimidazol reductase NimA-like FMN-containing flavoprotein (pyridoxamine 5'-phosphate oxidase superfamily)
MPGHETPPTVGAVPPSAEPPSARATVRRLRERGSYERATIDAILDEGLVCHVGVVVDGAPVVLPTLHVRVGDTLYLHGAAANAMLRAGSTGATCVTVTLVDGLVLARSAFHHSINYRSVVVHGEGRAVTDEAEKRAALDALVDHVVAGRSAGCRPPNDVELKSTLVLALDLTEASAKVRTGPPKDDPEDLDGPWWAGVIPLTTTRGEPIPAPDLSPAARAGTP